MALSARTGLKQTQKTALTQQLIQSINLLQLSNMELAEKISAELLENPVLEEERITKTPETGPDDRDIEVISDVTKELSGDGSPLEKNEDTDISDDIYRESQFPDISEDDRKRRFIENAIAHEETLKEHLISQACMVIKDERVLLLVENIITSLDDNGFLTQDREEIKKQFLASAEEVSSAISIVNNLDPVGCGARDVLDSLIIQAEIIYPEDAVLHELLKRHFLDLEKMQYDKIARALDMTVPEIIEKNRFVHNLNPFPGRDYGTKNIKYIIPDIEVKVVGNDIYIYMNDDWIPEIRINSYYKNILTKKSIDKNLKQYLKDKMQSAKFLMESISNRRHTIIKVVNAIMENQRDFLLRGAGFLKPLVYSDIARETGLHESTVGRVACNKYVQTSWGVYELKSFFVSRLKSSNTESHSSDEILSHIRNIIENESNHNPVTDDDIVKMLKEKNINVARRTIAKYRGMLDIPSSGIRKKINISKNKR